MHRSARALALAAPLLLATACGLEQLWKSDGSATPAVARPADVAADGTCPAAVAPGQPFELPPDIVAPDYPEAPMPAEPPLLRLDLAAGRVQAYTSETTHNGPNPFEDDGKDGYTVRERVELKGVGNHLGRYLVHGKPPPGFPGGAAEMLQGLVVDVGDDTTIRGRVSQELELQMRFPLPPAPLTPGAAVARPVRFPIDHFGAFFFARGLMTFMLDRYVTVDGHRGVQYRVKLDIHDVDRVPDVAAAPTVAITAHAVVVFDLDDRSFVAVRSHTSSKVDMGGAPFGEFGGRVGPPVAESRAVIDRDPARSTPGAPPEPPVASARCGVPVTPGAAFTAPPELTAAVTYPDAPAPATPPKIRWDFSAGKVHAYAATLVEPTPNPFIEGSTESRSFATWMFHAQGDGRARHVGYERIDDPSETDPKLADMLPVSIVDVADDTSVDGRISQEAELRLRFPIPPAPLLAGQPLAVPFEFPLNAMGAMYYARGTTTYQLDRHVQVDGRPAVQYSVKTEVLDIDAPPEAPNRPDLTFEHHAVAVFDPEAGNFVAVHTLEKKRVDLSGAVPDAARGLAPRGRSAVETILRTTTLRDPSRVADPMPRKP